MPTSDIILQTELLNEAIDLTEATNIDLERRQINGVVLIKAGMSKNRKFYSEAVLRNSVPIFEGAKAYANHPDPAIRSARSVRELTGWYSNVHYEEGRGLIADRHFIETSAGNDVWAIAKAVKEGRAPKHLAGLSINAVGNASRKKFDDGDALNVESITAAQSVDDVSEAAAGGTYLGESTDTLTTAFYKTMLFEEWRDSRPDYLERMKKSWQEIKRDEQLAAALDETKGLKSQLKAIEDFRAEMVDTEKLQSDLKEAQGALQAKRSEHDTAVEQLTAARRELGIERALRQVNLPSQWEKDLRESLLKTPESEWAGIIDREKAKAKSAGHRVSVSGAGQQVNAPLKEAEKPKEISGRDLLPKPSEKIDDWQRRIAHMTGA